MVRIGANIDHAGWGGGIAFSASGRDGAGSSGLSGLGENEFRGLDASEGVAMLAGDFADVKPDIQHLGEAGFPGPIAEQFFWDDSAVVVIQGPVGSGKTTTLLRSRLRRASMMPRSVIDGIRRYKLTVIRATYRQLWTTTIPDFLKVFPRHLGQWSGGRGGPVNFSIEFEDVDGPIEFQAELMAFGDDIVGSMRGLQTTDLWLHEFDTNPHDVLDNGITRIKRFPDQAHFRGYPAEARSYGQVVGDMNAPEKDNWAFGLLHDPRRRAEVLEAINRGLPEGAPRINIAFYRQPGFGEPGVENMANLPVGYYETQIATLTLAGKGDLIDRLVRNKVTWRRLGEPVFRREFNATIHVADVPIAADPDLPLRIGLDQGFKGAAVVGQYHGRGRWRILGELYFPDERLLAREFGRRLREYLDDTWPGLEIEGGWGDMAGEHGSSLATDENETWNLIVSRSAGVPIIPQRVGTNRINPRLEAVRAALETIRDGQPGLLIQPTCDFLISGFSARYVWRDEIDASGDKRKVPDKSIGEANVMDALQYLLLSESGADGLTDETFTGDRKIGRPVRPDADGGGLITSFDVLEPYGG